MTNDELQEELSPGCAIDLAGPGWQGVALDPPEQAAALVGTVDHGGDAPVRGERQQPLFRRAVDYVVTQLNKIQRLFFHNGFQFLMAAAVGSGDAQIPNLALFLHLPEGFQVGFPVPQVVHLHEVHPLHAHKPHGLRHLAHAGLPAVSPHLGGGEQGGGVCRGFQQLAHQGLGRAVHGRRIDELAAVVEKSLQHRAQLLPGRGVRKGAVSAKPHHGKGLAGAGNSPLDDRVRQRVQVARQGRQRDGAGASGLEQAAS